MWPLLKNTLFTWISNNITECEVYSCPIKKNTHTTCSLHFLIAWLVYSAHILVFHFISSLCWTCTGLQVIVTNCCLHCRIYSKITGRTSVVSYFKYLCFLINRTEEKILQLQFYHAWDVAVSCWGKICSVSVSVSVLTISVF